MTTKEITEFFVMQTKGIFDSFLNGYRFSRKKAGFEEYSFEVLYRNENRYINFGCTLHPHDFPYYSYLSLGEGSNEFPESDWNSIPLWRFFDKNDENANKNLYSFDQYPITEDFIKERVQKNRVLLEKYGGNFLMGDLEQFKKIRAEQNKSREPYKIYTPDETGRYNLSYEKRSSELKEKYSKE